jgi:hypothetical protein
MRYGPICSGSSSPDGRVGSDPLVPSAGVAGMSSGGIVRSGSVDAWCSDLEHGWVRRVACLGASPVEALESSYRVECRAH